MAASLILELPDYTPTTCGEPRPAVFIENGHVTHFTFAVIDIPKEQNTGNDRHGSKVIVVPFDGAALDRDLGEAVTQEKAASHDAGGQ